MRERATDRDGYSGKGESAFGGIVKSKTGAEMALILAERALMPTICLVNLVKLCATMTGISFIFTYGGTRKGENEVSSRSRWSTQDMTDLHHVEKKKSNSCLAPHIVLHFPLMHGCCHVAGQREGEGDRNRGRERQEHRMRSWGGGWPPSLVSTALPRGKDVLNQAFVRRHNRSPARAQGCSV